jgi:hypothetical protein
MDTVQIRKRKKEQQDNQNLPFLDHAMQSKGSLPLGGSVAETEQRK